MKVDSVGDKILPCIEETEFHSWMASVYNVIRVADEALGEL